MGHACNHNTPTKAGELNEFEAIQLSPYFNKTEKEQADKRSGKMVLIKKVLCEMITLQVFCKSCRSKLKKCS